MTLTASGATAMTHVLHVQLRYTIVFRGEQSDSNLWRSHRVRVWHTSFCSCYSSRVQIFVYGTVVPNAASIRTRNIYVHEVRKEGLGITILAGNVMLVCEFASQSDRTGITCSITVHS